MRGVAAEQSPADRAEDFDKDKKKKRRSNRRSKQNSSLTAVCSSVDETHRVAPEFLGNGSTSSNLVSNEGRSHEASTAAFNSLRTMHINEQATQEEDITMQDQETHQSDYAEKTLSKSCYEPVGCEYSVVPHENKVVIPSQQTCHAQNRYFVPHWPMEAVNSSLETGDVYRAVFRVNAHNRLEAYCKIDGLQIDVLINGCAAQNRAVEGDVVAIEVDPLSLWTKMKGSNGNSNNSPVLTGCKLLPEVIESVGDGCKLKNKVDMNYGDANCSRYLHISEKGSHSESKSLSCENVCSESIGRSSYNYVNDHCSFVPDQLGKLCAIVEACPSKRPTGRVVSIIERSPRRDNVIGFLSVKQWVSNREGCKRENKITKSLLPPNCKYIMFMPTDPKFPKMMVFLNNLPDYIRKRLEDGDVSVQMELVAVQVDDWGEGDFLPKANVTHVFGRGGEVEPQIAAILFENAIISSDFLPDSLSCLPHAPWEVPQEELLSRRDLRKLCMFTIDPTTATDLDDALSVEMLSNGIFRIGVHIADVSFFVLPNTALDIEAQLRSTSVYMRQRKLPMLPRLLSEDIGSLNPGVDKLAFSIFWDMNLAGEVLDRWIGRTVIRSCCKLSYEHAQDIIDGFSGVGSSNLSENVCPPKLHGNFLWSDMVRSVKILHDISRKLRENRFNDGALSLECSKLVVLFDEDGIPYDSMLSERTDSNFLVEEFMLLANRTVAEVISRAYPDCALLRRHPDPNLRKLKEFEAFCRKHGLELDASTSGQLNHSLEQIKDQLKDDSVFLNILINYAAKPMQLASYFCSGEFKNCEKDWGHYALAVPLYTHFTSPIRRYPDIVVHRILAATIDAEEMIYLKNKSSTKLNKEEEKPQKCFSGICFDKNAAESIEGQEALSVAAAKHRVPGAEILADVASHCNERKLASRHAQDASDKLFMWVLLKRKEIIYSEARVLGVGPKFMSIYIHKLAIERRIYYDEVEELAVEWLDATSTLVLNLSTTTNSRRFQQRRGGVKWRALDDVAMVVTHPNTEEEDDDNNECSEEMEPAVFPITVRALSTIPVALHAVGGDCGPLEIEARLYTSSYLLR